jgi:hypothetical protein
MKYDILMKLQTDADMTSWDFGAKFLSPLFRETWITPDRAATFGEVTATHGFDVKYLGECRAHWGSKAVIRTNGSLNEFVQDFHWKRRKVSKSQGYVTFAETSIKGKRIPGRVLFQSQYRNEVDWASLFVNWCKITAPFAAILHPLISKEDHQARSNKDVRNYSWEEEISQQAWSRFLGGEFYCEFRAGEMNTMVTGLTNLGWASFFGGKHVEEVDEVAISAAGFPVQKIGSGYLVQVTDNISDVVNDFSGFSRKRSRLRSLFRDGLFLIKDDSQAS